MNTSITEMTIGHYPRLVELWKSDSGIGTGLGDDQEGIQRYLDRNPSMSFIAESEGEIVGTILAGHDGRRGYIYHLLVAPEFRGHKIGDRLLESALTALAAQGIPRCLITVLKDNAVGNGFWRAKEWTLVDFVNVYSKTL